ncbi:hypothetical protein DICPUDRAFT_158575 [Dictyostelium purpureum]|uniref:Protein-serine/threonine phosphatase n=1 Tax=Dictyostelium purpureum TaxID=5786 RepID=F1A1X9_DICPU|nr:uncharacterized protein DICPUDRAFT_158575 [Dictyostelium purpureum]EGC29808.1 hypothetical protein DICPUDRAFT_158575 [Dictyostelium purpureum]|eukprot:XP_003293673.1 hypothetical protein DICPUDRAFT_158575 [Dictyostelium purpureum]
MGNTHSNNNNNGGDGVSEINMIVDLDGKYHIDYKNRNFKKLKTQLFSAYFESYEIVSADSLVNSDFFKNKLPKKSQLNNSGGIGNNNSNNNSTNNNNSNNSSDSINTANTNDGTTDNSTTLESKEENTSFLQSSPVPSPSSSLSKRHQSEFQLNPELTIDKFNEELNNEEKAKENGAAAINKGTAESPAPTPTPTPTPSAQSTPSSTPSSTPKQKSRKERKDKKENVNNNQISINNIKSDIKIYSVDLSINRLEHIPNEILSIMNTFGIEELCLSTNFFHVIPDINLVKSLTSVNLSKNKITKIPSNVFTDLPNLTTLILDRNGINCLPEEIGCSTSLKFLSLKHNLLEVLPNSFTNLKQLVTMDMSQNRLKSLPNNFEDLINLQMVWLSNNQISSLPSTKKLVNLEMFDISSNKLSSLPKDFAYLVPKKQNGSNIRNSGNIDLINRPNSCNSNSNILEILTLTELEGGGLGVLKELNIRDNRELPTIPAEYKQVESNFTLITSIPSEIIPGVFLGGLDSANNAPILAALGITHIVLAIGDCEPFFPKNFKYYSIDDARDTPNYDISQHFEQTNCFIEQGRRSGGVLVHCRAGISRSSTLILSYLMRYHQMTFKQASDFVQLKRPQILPNPGFRDQLLKYESKLYCNNILKKQNSSSSPSSSLTTISSPSPSSSTFSFADSNSNNPSCTSSPILSSHSNHNNSSNNSSPLNKI